MRLDIPETPPDSPAQRRADRRRWQRALNTSLAFVLLLAAIYTAQGSFDVDVWTLQPHRLLGLTGLVGAPLLHGSGAHLLANMSALLILGTLALGMYPRATWRALPLLWVGPGVMAWFLGESGTHHLGASGLAHGLMFLVLALGLLRRDRPAIAAAMIAITFYGGALLTVLPREAGVSWQMHLGGAVAGIIAALLWRRLDPQAPRRRYSWEFEDEAASEDTRETFEPPRPQDVPVLWHRPSPARGQVLPFERRPRDRFDH